MTILILLVLILAICIVVDASLEYDEAGDSNPNNIWHKILRSFHNWICDEEVILDDNNA